ncbi:hypothetical protein M231_03121 [Tremella mesenterica]|uniref:Retrotransposon gag domain-containing protein n=1 Tax=Tremella mesenterica TaxID=5217 RepID=A0A4Q1BP30_TREME|nr:hypothetical protein M231_03121 [Tremella mesenterica]
MVEEMERRMLEELRQSLGPLPGAIDTPEGSTQGDDFYPPLPLEPPPQPTGLSEPPTVRTGSEDSGQTPRPREGNTGGRLSSVGSEVVGGTEEEATTQKMMLAIMNMMMETNKDMIAERKHREEQEKKKEQETVGGIVEGISEGVQLAMGRQASATPGVAEMSGGIKLPLPDLWRGERSKLTAFISECEVHFEINAHKFPTDQNGLASAYFAAFQRYVAVLGWGDDGNLMDRAKNGLKSHLLDEIPRHGKVFKTVRELIEFVVPMDNRLHQQRVEKENEKKRKEVKEQGERREE